MTCLKNTLIVTGVMVHFFATATIEIARALSGVDDD